MTLNTAKTAKKILLLYTGGTVGMESSAEGLVPQPGVIARLLNKLAVQTPLELITALPLIDSSCLNFSHWQQWLQILRTGKDNYRAVVLLHGTDTLAYTAAMLALLAPLLPLPVIITGAMIPWGRPQTDAAANLEQALNAAITVPSGVFVAFGGQLLSPLSCVKVSTFNPRAFFSPHGHILATFYAGRWQQTAVKRELFYPVLNLPLPFDFAFRPTLKIFNLYFTPASGASDFDMIIGAKPAAVILQSFGNGNVALYPRLKTLLAVCRDNSVPVLNVSQVLMSRVEGSYAPAAALEKLGVINSLSLTIEVVLALTAIILNLSPDAARRQKLLRESILTLDKTVFAAATGAKTMPPS